MKTAIILLIVLSGITPIAIVSTICAIRFFNMNLRLDKENESLSEQLSKFQAREQSRQLEDIEVLNRMVEDLEHEELIYMNT